MPTPQQVAWADKEMGVIIHLDINIYAPDTFDYKKKSTLPNANAFNPSKLNTDQWLRTAKAAGARYALLTVKHGTGFGLWPSKVNNYNVGHTAWRNGKSDIVKDFIASCIKYGIEPGFYYNTNTNTYYNTREKGFETAEEQLAYNQAVLAQLTELWTGYGRLFEIWFDGGIMSDSKGGIEGRVKQLVRTHQPQAILFQGPLELRNVIRWVGNEEGIAGETQWSRTNATTGSNGIVKIDGLTGDPKGKYWCPAESDVPIKRNNSWNGGWLWKANEDNLLFTVRELTDKYEKSVGRNTNMLIGMIIDTSGLVPKADSLVFDSLGKKLHVLYGNPVAQRENINGRSIEMSIKKGKTISRIMLQEDIKNGENIMDFFVYAYQKHVWVLLTKGHSIGHKRILVIPETDTRKIKITFSSLSGNASLKRIAVFK